MKKFLTKEQADELIKLGLDPKTADCVISDTQPTGPCIFDTDEIQDPSDVPTWSLSRILELLPKELYSEERNLFFPLTIVMGDVSSCGYQTLYGYTSLELIDALFKVFKYAIQNHPDKINKT